MALHIPADKDTILITTALIKSAGLDTVPNQVGVDATALQIGQHRGREPAGLRECKRFPWLRCCPLLGRRGAVTTQGFHRTYKVYPLDFYQVVQRRPAPDAPAVLAPFPIGDFETVMGAGAVFTGAAPFQLMRLMGLQI